MTCKLSYKQSAIIFRNLDNTAHLEYRFKYPESRWIIWGGYGSVLFHVKHWELA
jgi:hypothetical protein